MWRLPHLSSVGLSLFGGVQSIRQVQISFIPAQVKERMLLSGSGLAGAGHRQQASHDQDSGGYSGGCNEKCMDWIPIGSEGLWGISEAWGIVRFLVN